MGGQTIWKPDVVDWDLVSVESYSYIIEQAQARLDELINESLAITSWGMKILLAYVAGLSGIVGYIFSTEGNLGRNTFSIIVIVPVAILSIYVFTLLFGLVAVRSTYLRGSQPKDLYRWEIFSNLDLNSGYKKLLRNEIERMQEKIGRIHSENIKRLNRYKFVLRISLFLIALLVFVLVKKIFDPT
jgi:hypothetical protein